MYTAARSRSSSLAIDFRRSSALAMSCWIVWRVVLKYKRLISATFASVVSIGSRTGSLRDPLTIDSAEALP